MAQAQRRSTSRSARAEPPRPGAPAPFRSRAALVLGLGAALVVALGAAGGARAQSVTPQLGDPKKCVVILDDMGKVGFRISDAQVVADAVLQAFRKRVGFESAHYQGVATSAATMKKLLATPEGAGPQETQLAWFKACEQTAPWRLRARFGTEKAGKKGPPTHWVTVSCRKQGEASAVVEEKRFEGATFLEARDALAAALPGFCPAIAGRTEVPIEGAPPAGPSDAGPPGLSKKKKEAKPWTPPPRRD